MALKVAAHGISRSSDTPSPMSIVVDEFRKKILAGLVKSKEIRKTKKVRRKAMRGVRDPRLSEPKEAGWTFLINKKNAAGRKVIHTVSELAKHREMDDEEDPLLFNDSPQDTWELWIEKYKTLRKGPFKTRPRYVLIIGSADEIPIEFQSRLSRSAFVGRLDFDNVNELQTYVKKIIRIEQTEKPLVAKNVTFFATDYGVTQAGCYDPTHFSRLDAENDLTDDVKNLHKDFPQIGGGFTTSELFVEKATKPNLFKSIETSKPALVFASSWGMCVPGGATDLQKKYTGAICCQGDPGNMSADDLLVTAESIADEKPDKPILEGGVFFQHTSFGFGTPASSQLHKFISGAEKWGMPKKIAQKGFVAELPKALVFREHGPLAFIGHFDEMLSYTYAPNENYKEDKTIRLQPLSATINQLLRGNPVGYAIGNSMNNLLDDIDNAIYDKSVLLHKVNKNLTEKELQKEYAGELLDKFLERHQATNFMVFGDPAAQILV